MRESILNETLNEKAKERGFRNWEEFCLSIPSFQKMFIEECVRSALAKVNWQGVLR